MLPRQFHSSGLLASLCAVSLCVLATRLDAEDPGRRVKEGGFESLFDGRTLQGWEGNTEVFRVERRSIVAGSLSKEIRHNEFLCTRAVYGDFELRLQAKLVGAGHNAGIQFRSQRIPDHHEVRGYQCDIGSMDAEAKQLIWGALYDESRRRRFLVEPPQEQLQTVVKPNRWNNLRIRCEGRRIQIWVNGFQSVDFTEMDPGMEAAGILGLQIHGGAPAEAHYRKIRIRQL